MKVRSLEAQRLNQVEEVLNRRINWLGTSDMQEARFQLLECAASRIGGFSLPRFQKAFNIKAIAPISKIQIAAREIIEAIEESKIKSPLAISALAREALIKQNRRSTGAYHTDFRLATHLAKKLAAQIDQKSRVIDPACGAGILLTALAIEVCGSDRLYSTKWLAESVFAADVSTQALRGTLLSLACLTDDIDALIAMRSRWYCGDSLMRPRDEWLGQGHQGFDAVIANPPWEKVKATRHEYIQSTGQFRHYGADYADFDKAAYGRISSKARSYARAIKNSHSSTSRGEPDLFIAFTELALKLLKPAGQMGLIVPAGLIRSKNTSQLRHEIFSQSSKLEIEIIENRSRFFEIDTRFKFLILHIRTLSNNEKKEPIQLSFAAGTANALEVVKSAKISRIKLAAQRKDLSIPEVRSDREWQLFCQMSEVGINWSHDHSPWFPTFCREVDMTRDRPLFIGTQEDNALPVIEGRMVHQYRVGSKTYHSGRGRSAIWEIQKIGESKIEPQFFVKPDNLSDGAARRSNMLRVGFCDITGQTNERTMLASTIPAAVVCGNKVPTILFENDPNEDRLWLWIAIANSLPFDWMVRRIVTTTINYFHLLSLNLPPIEPNSLPGRQLVKIAKSLSRLDKAGDSIVILHQIAKLRAQVDRMILKAYGLNDDHLMLILEDFPLLDRAQPPLPADEKSTITADLLLAQSRNSEISERATNRVEAANAIGSIGYIPTQIASLGQKTKGHLEQCRFRVDIAV